VHSNAFQIAQIKKKTQHSLVGEKFKKNGKKIVCAACRGKFIHFFEKKMEKNVSATFSRHLSECLRVPSVATATFILQVQLPATHCNSLQLTATH